MLLECGAGGQEQGQRIAAATYLKNYLKRNWSESPIMSHEEKLEFRNQLVEVLLRVEGLVLKILTEAVGSVPSTALRWISLAY